MEYPGSSSDHGSSRRGRPPGREGSERKPRVELRGDEDEVAADHSSQRPSLEPRGSGRPDRTHKHGIPAERQVAPDHERKLMLTSWTHIERDSPKRFFPVPMKRQSSAGLRSPALERTLSEASDIASCKDHRKESDADPRQLDDVDPTTENAESFSYNNDEILIQANEPTPSNSPNYLSRKNGPKPTDVNSSDDEKIVDSSRTRSDGDGARVEIEAAEDDVELITLEEDVYSLMFVSGTSRITLYSVATVVFQIMVICLVSWDIVRDLGRPNGDKNPLNAPLNVDVQVRIAQLLAMPLAVMVHRDCTTAIYLLQARYESERVHAQSPNATKKWWYISLFLRFYTGFCLVGLSFVLILQSDRIISLFLNLAALVFIGEIDDFAFYLAKRGFFKKELQDACAKTEGITMHPWQGTGRTVKRRIILFITWVILFCGWAVVAVYQELGFYIQTTACQSFAVQFGSQEFTVRVDDINFDSEVRDYSESIFDLFELGNKTIAVPYSFFSGNYEIGRKGRGIVLKDDRPVFYEVVSSNSDEQDDISVGFFRFCSEHSTTRGQWIFKVKALADATHPEKQKGDCDNWLLRSPVTSSFLLKDVSGTWEAWTGSIVPAQDFTIDCEDCRSDDDCNLQGTCNPNKICTCTEGSGFTGNTCSLPKPCEAFNVFIFGSESRDFFESGRFELLMEDSFEIEKSINPHPHLVYGRPLYLHIFDENLSVKGLHIVQNPPESTEDFSTDVDEYIYCSINDPRVLAVFYSGNRWFASSTCASKIYDFFYAEEASSHSFWDQNFDGSVFSLSGPTLSATPQGIQWFNRRESLSVGNFGTFGALEPITIAFVCADNDDVNDCTGLCGEYGKCNTETNECECNTCFGGVFCEFSPRGQYAGDEFQELLENSGYSPSDYYERYWANENLPMCAEFVNGF